MKQKFFAAFAYASILIIVSVSQLNAQDIVTTVPEDETGERLARLESAYEHLATKADIESLRGELKADIESLRGELKADIESLRGELKADIESLRGELKADTESLRGELKADTESLRGELKADTESLRGELKGLRGELDGMKWTVVIGIAASAVIASIAGPLLTMLLERRNQLSNQRPVPSDQ